MGYEVKVAYCEKELGTACIFLKQYEKGLAVCMELGNEEYVYHFNILRSLNEDEAIKLLEEVKKVFLTSKSKVYGIL
ncbi:aspartate phosphatase [Bacillus thuringiensis]|uniref:aspartate phosphatase n=1 Tax=Bacillus TaxID=1386 RepID=UPI000CDE7DE8|nr:MULTISPECIES: aspartate phosphatase [Bacillus]MED3350366.1 aspartate phosphatase [Bacillus thuringiensis]MRB08291.1 aspartate phosphatase [Bacillus thuringiensis]HDX9692967.1 aspartate phosphatase [Bacillus thuringiensis]